MIANQIGEGPCPQPDGSVDEPDGRHLAVKAELNGGGCRLKAGKITGRPFDARTGIRLEAQAGDKQRQGAPLRLSVDFHPPEEGTAEMERFLMPCDLDQHTLRTEDDPVLPRWRRLRWAERSEPFGRGPLEHQTPTLGDDEHTGSAPETSAAVAASLAAAVRTDSARRTA